MRYFEELHVGDTFRTATVTVTEADIAEFARLYDPQPFHLDAEAARETMFGRLVASGWHTAALTMRLIVQGEVQPAGGMVGLGVEQVSWPRPVLPGDKLRAVSEILELRLSRSKPDRGLAKIRTTTFNQCDEPVQVMTSIQIVLRRPASGA
jgi:acyl dehydratase